MFAEADSSERINSTCFNRQVPVRYDEAFVDSDGSSESLAIRAGTIGIIKRKEIGLGFLEGHAVEFEAVVEVVNGQWGIRKITSGGMYPTVGSF